MIKRLTFIIIFFYILESIILINSTFALNLSNNVLLMNNVNNTKTSTSNISKVSINIVFDSLLINNDRSIFGDGKWNFSIFAKNKTLDLLTNSKVKNNQLINLNEKNISLIMPISEKVHLSALPIIEKYSGKWDLLDYFSEKYDLLNNFGKGNHTIFPDNGKENTLHLNLLDYKYTIKIKKDPDYVLKYHILTTFLKA